MPRKSKVAKTATNSHLSSDDVEALNMMLDAPLPEIQIDAASIDPPAPSVPDAVKARMSKAASKKHVRSQDDLAPAAYPDEDEEEDDDEEDDDDDDDDDEYESYNSRRKSRNSSAAKVAKPEPILSPLVTRDGRTMKQFLADSGFHYHSKDWRLNEWSVGSINVYRRLLTDMSEIDLHSIFPGFYYRSYDMTCGMTILSLVSHVFETAKTNPGNVYPLFELVSCEEVEKNLNTGGALREVGGTRSKPSRLYKLDAIQSTTYPVVLPMQVVKLQTKSFSKVRYQLLLPFDFFISYENSEYIVYVDCKDRMFYDSDSSIPLFTELMNEILSLNETSPKIMGMVFYNVRFSAEMLIDKECSVLGQTFGQVSRKISKSSKSRTLFVISHPTRISFQGLEEEAYLNEDAAITRIIKRLGKTTQIALNKVQREHKELYEKLMECSQKIGELSFIMDLYTTNAYDRLGEKFKNMMKVPGIEKIIFIEDRIVATTVDLFYTPSSPKMEGKETLMGKYIIDFNPSNGSIYVRNLKQTKYGTVHPHWSYGDICASGYLTMIESAYRSMQYDMVLRVLIDMLSNVTESDSAAFEKFGVLYRTPENKRVKGNLSHICGPRMVNEDEDDEDED